MKITRHSFEIMDKMISAEPPESGGILGSSDGKCITDVILDKTDQTASKCCRYEPNVDYLNECIAEWLDRNISFKGIFHTHFAGVATLSDADIQYIESIMQAMPAQIEYLYFPIFVLPERELVSYKAKKTGTKINIIREETIFS